MIDTPVSLQPAFRARRKAKRVDSQKLGNNQALKQQLLREMLSLDQRIRHMELCEGSVNFAMLQSCKEMIQSRRLLLEELGQ